MRENPRVTNPDRLTGLDASFLALEDGGAHMHVGSVLLFEGAAPDAGEFVAQIERRLGLVPRYRQKLAFPPLVQSRPVWVDDPHFNAGYHVRHTALPEPAGEAELRRLAGRVFAQRLDRSKPLWELWLVDRVGDDHFALITKTHHALVDGVSGVDIATVLFDLDADPPPQAPPEPWVPRPEPTAATLLADALVERASTPVDLARAAAGALSRPQAALAAGVAAVNGLAAMTQAGLSRRAELPAERADRAASPLRVGRRRPRTFKAIKDALGGTVNDVVLTVVERRAAQPLPRARLRHRRRAQGDGAGLDPRGVRARRARQPGGGDVRAAADRARRPDRALPGDPRGDARPEGLRPGGRRRGDHDAGGLRAADDPVPGRAPAGGAALLQPRR